jgi:hypothetical protein
VTRCLLALAHWHWHCNGQRNCGVMWHVAQDMGSEVQGGFALIIDQIRLYNTHSGQRDCLSWCLYALRWWDKH